LRPLSRASRSLVSLVIASTIDVTGTSGGGHAARERVDGCTAVRATASAAEDSDGKRPQRRATCSQRSRGPRDRDRRLSLPTSLALGQDHATTRQPNGTMLSRRSRVNASPALTPTVVQPLHVAESGAPGQSSSSKVVGCGGSITVGGRTPAASTTGFDACAFVCLGIDSPRRRVGHDGMAGRLAPRS
jgi:hypothetical protein